MLDVIAIVLLGIGIYSILEKCCHSITFLFGKPFQQNLRDQQQQINSKSMPKLQQNQNTTNNHHKIGIQGKVHQQMLLTIKNLESNQVRHCKIIESQKQIMNNYGKTVQQNIREIEKLRFKIEQKEEQFKNTIENQQNLKEQLQMIRSQKVFLMKKMEQNQQKCVNLQNLWKLRTEDIVKQVEMRHRDEIQFLNERINRFQEEVDNLKAQIKQKSSIDEECRKKQGEMAEFDALLNQTQHIAHKIDFEEQIKLQKQTIQELEHELGNYMKKQEVLEAEVIKNQEEIQRLKDQLKESVETSYNSEDIHKQSELQRSKYKAEIQEIQNKYLLLLGASDKIKNQILKQKDILKAELELSKIAFAEQSKRLQEKIFEFQSLKQDHQKTLLNIRNELQTTNKEKQCLIREMQQAKSNQSISITVFDAIKNELQFCQRQLQSSVFNEEKCQLIIKQQQEKLKEYEQFSIFNQPQYLKLKLKCENYERILNERSEHSSIDENYKEFNKNWRQKLLHDSSCTEFFSQKKLKTNSEIFLISHDSDLQRSPTLNQIMPQTISVAGLFQECSFLDECQKQFIALEIMNIKKFNIKKTKLLYRFDKLHFYNPHQSIDSIPNILLLIELCNGKVLGAFTQIAFRKEDSNFPSNKNILASASKAMLIDLTNKKSYLNRDKNNTIIYDEKSLIFGKNELQIKFEQPDILYSSFFNGFNIYWQNTAAQESFIGSTKPFQQIAHYQIYRVYLG